jgi:hypothetical protein
MKRWLTGATLVVLAPFVWALPTVADVEAQVQKGNYVQAETMMQEVVTAKPQSARAHYVFAEILAHNGRFSAATAEEARARHLDPAMKFSNPADVRNFEELLEKERRRAPSDGTPLGSLGPTVTALPSAIAAQPVARQVRAEPTEARAASSGLPGWVWPVAIFALVLVAWRMIRSAGNAGGRGLAPAPAYGAPAYGAPGYTPGATAGIGGAAPGAGLMGVGLAAAGGLAAGMVAERLLDRGHGQRDVDAFQTSSSGAPYMPDPDARALEDRSIDFGTGNDWGDGGGSVDMGGGSDDGSW